MTCDKLVDAGCRQFLRGGVAATAVMTHEQAKVQGLARVDDPSNRLANITDLVVNEPLDVAYPNTHSTDAPLKLGQAVEGGVGPDGDIVAFSMLCRRKGRLTNSSAKDKTLNRLGQHSRVDCEASGRKIWGHTTSNPPSSFSAWTIGGDTCERD